ncbi:MAG: histidine phosphatase family protein [Candidatus Kerfeldbacteria bacterium]|nr:histidine phosphatase family protein [Candidatus Kerfeldbacteria bacterium]
MKHRAAAWFEHLRTQDMSKTVLVVSHGFFLYTLLEVTVEGGADVEREEYSMSNGGITMLDIHPEGRARIVHLNDIAHLGGMKTLPSAIRSMLKAD